MSTVHFRDLLHYLSCKLYIIYSGKSGSCSRTILCSQDKQLEKSIHELVSSLYMLSSVHAKLSPCQCAPAIFFWIFHKRCVIPHKMKACSCHDFYWKLNKKQGEVYREEKCTHYLNQSKSQVLSEKYKKKSKLQLCFPTIHRESSA